MRKIQQRQILELLETIREAQSAGMYADCQDGASSIGEFIEEIKGEGTQTVTLLEEYCELLYKASIGEIGEKPLHKQLIEIESSVMTELKPDRIEIAFLSYKASMSDSIESIYLAAKADPNCDAYWIPIPYCDLNSDGSVKEAHYEGAECYGGNLECTDYRDYDIEARHPDVIFTFSPYDASNFVTRIHPNYYCQRLRSLTDLLVYIPYFITLDSVPKGYLTVEGCMYAHKVIVQSEKLRDVFIHAFREKHGDSFGEPEDKFVALGSGKIDKVLNSKREDFHLPDKWSEIIGNKKVLYYNSSVTPALKGNEQYLEKLLHIIDTFRNRDDIALWWRPHPLTEATYKSMRPQLYDEYKQIVENYKLEGWGIYDDTPDLHRALAWSDAYYGDISSVLVLYGATGKPMMVNNHDVLTNEIHFAPASLCVYRDGILFSARDINALFKISKSDYEAKPIYNIPGEKDFLWEPSDWLYGIGVESGGAIYFSPCTAKEIAVYHLDDNSIEKIALDRDAIGEESGCKFWGAAASDDFIYFTSSMHTTIARLDTVKKTLIYYPDWPEPIKKFRGINCGFSIPIAASGSIWAASWTSNAVVELNTETLKSTVHIVGKKGWSYNAICFDGENFWVAPQPDTGMPFIKWNPKTGMVKEISSPPAASNCSFIVLYCSGYVWLLPNRGANHAYKIDTQTDSFVLAPEFEPCESDRSLIKYSAAQVFENSIYAHKASNHTLVQYNTVTNEREENVIRYSTETLAKMEPQIDGQFSIDIKTMITEFDCYYRESSIAPLKSFVDYVVREKGSTEYMAREKHSREIFKTNNTNADGTAGQAIYDFAKNLVHK